MVCVQPQPPPVTIVFLWLRPACLSYIPDAWELHGRPWNKLLSDMKLLIQRLACVYMCVRVCWGFWKSKFILSGSKCFGQDKSESVPHVCDHMLCVCVCSVSICVGVCVRVHREESTENGAQLSAVQWLWLSWLVTWSLTWESRREGWHIIGKKKKKRI